jgi:hypothetical protein
MLVGARSFLVVIWTCLACERATKHHQHLFCLIQSLLSGCSGRQGICPHRERGQCGRSFLEQQKVSSYTCDIIRQCRFARRLSCTRNRLACLSCGSERLRAVGLLLTDCRSVMLVARFFEN